LWHNLNVAFQEAEILDLLSDLHNAKVLSRFTKLFPRDLIIGIVNEWKIMKASFDVVDFLFLLLGVTVLIIVVILFLGALNLVIR
jgi:hypothetical protein